MNKNYLILALLLFCSLPSARTYAAGGDVPPEVVALTDSLKQKYAPDGRVALFKTDYTFDGKRVMLRGETTSPSAKAELVEALSKAGYEVMDCLKVLPDEATLEGKTYGIINLSVASLRVQPDYSSEMMTQALLGMPVRVLERDGWYRIQTPDDYIALSHLVSVLPFTR